jgi:REP element-mobilizing transposase RayT
MTLDNSAHHRRSLRLSDYDYSRAGLYFVTIVLHEHRCLLGTINQDVMLPSPAGKMIIEQWEMLPNRFPDIALAEFQLMPNHFHGIIHLVGAALVAAQSTESVGAGLVPTHVGATLVVAHKDAQDSKPMPTLGNIVGAFKSITTYEYIRGVKQNGWLAFNGKLWQRNYYEHIIRDNDDFERIADYIMTNPSHWRIDEENPEKDTTQEGS